MDHFRWQIVLGFLLVALSAILYFIHYLIFKDAHHIILYLIGDIAFLPIEVLLVTMVIHRLLDAKEKKARLEKLNMVIETFFSEMGTKVLTYFSDADPQLDSIRSDLIVTEKLSGNEFMQISKRLKGYDYTVDINKIDMLHLQSYLIGKRGFMVRLLENPVLSEHESFTEVLRTIFHLTEELAYREGINQLPDKDLQHLAGDMKRVYGLLVYQWLDYMKYLKANYPYLFSLAMRMNPFDRNASPVVK